MNTRKLFNWVNSALTQKESEMSARKLFNELSILALLLLLAMLAGRSTPMWAAEQPKHLTTDVSGHITTDTTWTLAGSPYVVTDDVTVDEGVTLTIEPGVVVKFNDAGDDLIVNGSLVAQGTEEEPIVFTSLKDDAHGGDTNEDGLASSPAPHDWGGIVFNASSSGNLLEHVWIGYGGSYGGANLKVYTNDVTIRDSVIGWSHQRGIYVQNASPTIENNEIRDNGTDGIYFNGFDDTQPVALTANTFISNTNWAVYAALSDEVVDVTLDNNTSTGSAYNGFGINGTISGTVTYSANVGFPFIVGYGLGDVTVQEPASLTIQPGTVVKLEGRRLLVNGSLVAPGTAGQPIVFTSLKDDVHGGDTNGDGSASSPAPNDWGSIVFNASSSGNVLEHAWIGYGGAYLGNVAIYTSDVAVRDSVIGWSSQRGIYVANASPTIEHNEIRQNNKDGIYFVGFDDTRPVELTANTFISNTNWAACAYLTDEVVDVTLDNNTSTGSAYNGFVINGTISGTVTYSTNVGFPFIVGYGWGDVTVQEPASLTIQPGTVVKFEGRSLLVNGSLVAQGTAGQPIVFTSLKDDVHGGDTNGDGSASSPAPNDWGSIVFNASSSGNVLEHAWIGYGGAWWGNVAIYTSDVAIHDSVIGWSSQRGIYVENASPTIEHNTIRDNNTGIHVTGDSQPTLRENGILNNDQYGVYTAYGSQPTLRGNAIFNNGQYGVYNADTSVIVDAASNWWGSSSGPYHSTANPFGEGDQVSNAVLFTPWLEYPIPGTVALDEVIVGVRGASRFFPGQVAHYGISYANLTTHTVESAVLVFALPYTADYEDSTAGGIYWPERHQVLWKLGDLAPGSLGKLTVKVRYLWGIPSGFQDTAMALLGGTNLYTDMIDVSPYLAYTPLEIVDETVLTEAQIEAERQAHPDMDTIYTQALADGFVFGTAVRFSVNGGEQVTQTLLLDLDRRAVMYLGLQGDQVIASTFEGSTYTLQDTTGGMTWNMQTGVREYWGSWSSGAATLSTQSPSGGGCCMRNCLTGVVVDSVLSKVSKAHDAWSKTKDFYDAVNKRTPDAIAKAAKNLIKNVPALGEVIGVTECLAKCAGDPHSQDCTGDKLTCEYTWWNIFRWLGVPSVKIYRCSGGCYLPSPVFRPCAFRQRCVPGKGCVSCTKPGVDCQQTTFTVARDPNAKYGPEGDLLPSQWVTYTITYENEGEGRAYGVFVVDELSEHFDETTLTVYGDGDFYTGTRTLSWYVGELAPKGEVGSEGAVTFTVRLKDDLPSGTVIVNQAVVHFPSVPEETPTNLVVNTIQPVVALPQSLETESGQLLTITLQGVEVSGLPLTFTVAEEPLYGELTGIAPTLVYTPMANFVGLDYFTFQASNGITESMPAEVQILVNPWSGDTTPPEIVWTEPEDGAVIAEVSATPVLTDAAGPAYAPFIVAQFSEVVSATTVTTETVQMVDGGGQPVSVTVTYNGVFNQAVVIPREPLQDNTRYTVIVSQGVKDLIGNPMEADYTWSFSIGAPPSKIYLPVILKSY